MYVGAPNLEVAAAHAVRLGGRECSPVIDVPTVGPGASNHRRNDEQAGRDVPGPPHWQIYFRVDKVVNAMDPHGGAFSLHARKR